MIFLLASGLGLGIIVAYLLCVVIERRITGALYHRWM